MDRDENTTGKHIICRSFERSNWVSIILHFLLAENWFYQMCTPGFNIIEQLKRLTERSDLSFKVRVMSYQYIILHAQGGKNKQLTTYNRHLNE